MARCYLTSRGRATAVISDFLTSCVDIRVYFTTYYDSFAGFNAHAQLLIAVMEHH